MKPEESFASRALRNVSKLMDYEVLVSRPGVSEPDSNFIWASTFRAPIGVSFVGESVYFNLFLPEGSEHEGDKKLFLSRVGAKFLDGLWQVRRSMDQVGWTYGPALKMAVTSFRSVILDYTYISKGRTFAHFTFNEMDLDDISETLLMVSNQLDGLRVEYLKKIRGEITVFKVINENEEVSTLTLEAFKDGHKNSDGHARDDGMFFVLGNILDKGVKTVGRASKNSIPEILKPSGVVQMGEELVSFNSGNQFLTNLVELMASNYIVVYGFYGSALNDSINLAINVPTQQTSALMRILRMLIEDTESWSIKLKEIVYFKDLIKES